MTFAGVLARAAEEERLFSVLLELTYRCNLACVFCYNDVGKRGRPLATDRYLRLLGELAEMEVLNLTLSGGEPLAHPGFFEIGARARALGFVVKVKTNGHAVGPREAARLRDEADPFLVEVSLHGARAATHERQTRVPGSFSRLVANVAAMREAGLRVRLQATLTRWNEDEPEAMLDLAAGLGVPLRFDPVVTPRDDGDPAPLGLAASEAGRARLFAALAARAGAPEAQGAALQGDDVAGPAPAAKHCGAGASTLTVDPYGDVFPCVQWRVPVGSLHESGLREIWERSPALGRVRRANEEVRSRLAAWGADAPLLSHCPGLAAREPGGDPAWVSAAQLGDLARRRAVRDGLALPSLPAAGR